MPFAHQFSEHPSYSEVYRDQPWIEMNPKGKEDKACNLCGQPMIEVRSRDVNDRKSFYLCPACKAVKQYTEDTSVRIVIE